MSERISSLPGIAFCFVIALPCWLLGKQIPVIGGPIFAILAGMVLAQLCHWGPSLQKGITYTSKKVLQLAVILLGFGLNLMEVARVGVSSLPVIVSTISISLVTAWLFHRIAKIPTNIATLIGVGSSICGGSAIAATAPVIQAKDEEVAQSISVIFLFNVIAALIFPALGSLLHLSNEGFGLFAGTAINDTSSVTAAASAWDGMHAMANTLDHATIVKLTRTLAILPITLFLAFRQARQTAQGRSSASFSLKKVFPFFVLFFLLASILTTLCTSLGADAALFLPFKELSKFFIIMAMAAIGLNTDVVHLVRTGGKPILLGFLCWIMITTISLCLQQLLQLW